MTKQAPIDPEIVKHVARLSRIALTEAEVKSYSDQLSVILNYIKKLAEIDTRGTPPTSHPLESLKNVFREDVVKDSLSPEKALINAPKRKNDYFSVPRIIE
ncbi:MAG: Asp-tRNA(Asn)/Glu-tRNA(Gln) amidotransferase subunit GatC [Candidatus Omnitrophota bacterium]